MGIITYWHQSGKYSTLDVSIMEPDKNTPANGENSDSKPAIDGQQASADALSMTPDELDKEEAKKEAEGGPKPDEPAGKKISPIKKLFRKVNLYFLIFALIVTVVAIVTIVNYLNSQKAPVEPNVASQTLTPDALKQLASTNTSVGSSSQTLTIQGSTIINGQTLARGNLSVAGNLAVGGSINAPNLTISGTSNLGTTQVNSLQVAQNTAIQGSTTLRDLSVAGTSTFSGSMTASQITVTNLILSGNAKLQIPNHIGFTGPSPGRSINAGVLGNGGSASVNGSDTTGTISVNTGNNPSAGCFAHVSFAQSFSAQPHVIVSPVGVGAGQTEYYVNRTTTGFDICTANAAPANSVFAYDYFVTD